MIITKLKITLLGVLCALAVRAQDGYTFLCDSNGLALSGFYLNCTNLTGTLPAAVLPTNYVSLATFQNGTNAVAANAAAALLSLSNQFSSVTSSNINPLVGSNNIPQGDGGSLQIGGFGNNANTHAGFNYLTVGLGGYSNLVYLPYGVTLGGWSNVVGYSAGSYAQQYNSAAIVGFRNAVAGMHSVILGGVSNTIFSGSGNVILGGFNNYLGLNINGGTAANCLAAGTGMKVIHNSTMMLGDSQGMTNVLTSYTNDQMVLRFWNGVSINTTNAGTNALNVRGNINASSLSLGGVDLLTSLNPLTTSNALSILWNYNLTALSNSIMLQVYTNSLGVAAVSNYSVASSNALSARLVTLSNAVNGIISGKAFTATVPATYSSIGIGFSTPLMPDANYSVSLVPQDQSTAEAPGAGLHWWVGGKNNYGFTIYTSYATNAYNLNFDCTVRENTQ